MAAEYSFETFGNTNHFRTASSRETAIIVYYIVNILRFF